MSPSPAADDLTFQPVGETERYRHLDVLRGLSLFGVLLVNLLTLFRVSLFQHMLEFHTDPGRANHLVDLLVAALVEFKAFTLFSFLFGVGTAIQAERSAARGLPVTGFLLRRFLVLLAIGLCHMFLIWNGDILLLYAVCGLLMVPTLGLPARTLAIFGIAAILLPGFVPLGVGFPGAQAWRAQAAAAMRVYGHGSYLAILAFRWTETWRMILPLVWSVLPRTAGLMWLGAAAWRGGLLRRPEQHRGLLWAVLVGGGVIGGATSFLHVLAKSSGGSSPLLSELQDMVSTIPLAFAYAAGLLLWMQPPRALRLTAPFGAAGQMALTNYLTQSIVLGFVFYGYGLGLFGRIGPAAGVGMAVAFYGAQLAFSLVWLRRYRFGPVEWLWRSLTYGRRQPMHRRIPLAK
jgi:uncharacterized protein